MMNIEPKAIGPQQETTSYSKALESPFCMNMLERREIMQSVGECWLALVDR